MAEHCRMCSIYEKAKSATLTLVFLVHLVPTAWGSQGCWCPDNYLFYNSLFFVILLWCIHSKESEEPVFLAFVVDVLAILLDVVVLSIYFSGIYYREHCSGSFGAESFSFAMATLNLVIRLFSCSVLHKNWKDRSAVSAGLNYSEKQFPKPGLKILPIDNVVIGSDDGSISHS